MLESVILSFLTGIIFGNGIPHFVRGITKERYPSMFGNSPLQILLEDGFALSCPGYWQNG